MASLRSAPNAPVIVPQQAPHGGVSTTTPHHSQSASLGSHNASTNTSRSTVGTTSTPHQPSSPTSPPWTNITTPSPISPSSPPNNISPTNPQRPQTPQGPLSNTARIRHKVFVGLKYWLKPLIALTVYAVTLGVAFSASARYTLLGRVSSILGTWFLAVLAKVGDLFYAYAVADAFDSIAWGTMTRSQRSSTPGVPLNWFLALVSSTGVFGLLRILWRGCWRRGKGAVAGVTGSWRERTKTTRWSLSRLLCMIVLVPGPGIILLADIDQTTIFFNVRSLTVGAGIAVYEPRIAPAISTVWGPEISKLVQMFLRDPSLVWEVKPISAACKANKGCKSYLLAGPYRTVTPWPFTVENDGVDGFKIEKAPFVQVDLWNPPPEPKLIFPNEPYCTLYGGFDPDNEYSMQLCLKNQDPDNSILIAGWVACQEGYSTTDLSCLSPGTQAGLQSEERPWSTYLSFYRRSATIIFSRNDFTIQKVSDLSHPTPQNITAPSLFQSINAILYRPNQTVNDFRYDRKSQRYVLTSILASYLWTNLYENAGSNSEPISWMKNLLTMPVFMFQPTFFGLSTDSEASLPITYNGSIPQPGLKPEHYVKGSYCMSSKRAIPGEETVIAYACIAGFVVFCVFVAKVRAWRWVARDTTEYSLLDYEVLLGFSDESDQPVQLKDRFQGTRYDDGKVLDEVASLKVKYVGV